MDGARETTVEDPRLEHGVILVADADPDSARSIEATLALQGYDVVLATDTDETLAKAQEIQPDLLLCNFRMAGPDAASLCHSLREDAATERILVIGLISATLMSDRVAALDAGADDFITRPFDQKELLARVRATLRRSRMLRDANPLTGLPGNVRVRKELQLRIDREADFAMLHVDLDNFKAFNDRYGFSRGDEALRTLADVVREAARAQAGPGAFVGHLGGDDIVAVMDPDNAAAVAEHIVEEWNRRAPFLYDEADAERGYVEVADRQRISRRYPISRVSIGIATTERRRFSSPIEAAEVASAMKLVAKRESDSSIAVDRRSDDEMANAG